MLQNSSCLHPPKCISNKLLQKCTPPSRNQHLPLKKVFKDSGSTLKSTLGYFSSPNIGANSFNCRLKDEESWIRPCQKPQKSKVCNFSDFMVFCLISELLFSGRRLIMKPKIVIFSWTVLLSWFLRKVSSKQKGNYVCECWGALLGTHLPAVGDQWLLRVLAWCRKPADADQWCWWQLLCQDISPRLRFLNSAVLLLWFCFQIQCFNVSI